jgi:hypothetical protein
MQDTDETPIAALRWQANAHRHTAAKLWSTVADLAAEVAQRTAAADDFERAADRLQSHEDRDADADNEGWDELPSIDLLRFRASEHRDATAWALHRREWLKLEAEMYDSAAAHCERGADLLERIGTAEPAR